MRTLIWFAYFWAYLLFLMPSLSRAEKLHKNGHGLECEAIVQAAARAWANALLRLAGVNVEVFGLENIPDEPVVFVCNHQGNFDIPILLTALPRANGILAKKELQRLPFINRWMLLLHCVFIDRSNPRQAVGALNTAAKNLQAGYSVVVFPEGTRSRCAEIREFKAGAFKIATKTKAQIVPLKMEGSYKVMEQNHGFIRPATVRLTVLPPVATAGLSADEAKALPQYIREVIEKGVVASATASV